MGPALPDSLVETLATLRRAGDTDVAREIDLALEEVAALAREVERYAQVFEYLPDAYVVTDAAGSIREANRAALELLGRNRDGIVGCPLAGLPMPAGLTCVVRPLALKDGQAGGLCWRLRPPSEEGAPLSPRPC